MLPRISDRAPSTHLHMQHQTPTSHRRTRGKGKLPGNVCPSFSTSSIFSANTTANPLKHHNTKPISHDARRPLCRGGSSLFEMPVDMAVNTNSSNDYPHKAIIDTLTNASTTAQADPTRIVSSHYPRHSRYSPHPAQVDRQNYTHSQHSAPHRNHAVTDSHFELPFPNCNNHALTPCRWNGCYPSSVCILSQDKKGILDKETSPHRQRHPQGSTSPPLDSWATK